MLILLVITVSASECDTTIQDNNITVSDSVEPDGKGSDCRASLSRDSFFIDIKNMSRQESFYQVNFTDLNYDGEYNVFIECNKSTDVFFSECDFVLDDDRLKLLDCPDTLPDVLMFIFIFGILLVAYFYSVNVVKISIVEIIIAVGFMFFSFALLGCNQLIGMIGIMMSIAMILMTLFKN